MKTGTAALPPHIRPKYGLPTTIAVKHMHLAAAALGLASCWIGAFNAEQVREILNIPEEIKVVALPPIGMSAGKPEPRDRKSLTEIVSYEKYAF